MTQPELREQYRHVVTRWRRQLEDGAAIPDQMLDELVAVAGQPAPARQRQRRRTGQADDNADS
jgi:hypothetical protein